MSFHLSNKGLLKVTVVLALTVAGLLLLSVLTLSLRCDDVCTISPTTSDGRRSLHKNSLPTSAIGPMMFKASDTVRPQGVYNRPTMLTEGAKQSDQLFTKDQLLVASDSKSATSDSLNLNALHDVAQSTMQADDNNGRQLKLHTVESDVTSEYTNTPANDEGILNHILYDNKASDESASTATTKVNSVWVLKNTLRQSLTDVNQRDARALHSVQLENWEDTERERDGNEQHAMATTKPDSVHLSKNTFRRSDVDHQGAAALHSEPVEFGREAQRERGENEQHVMTIDLTTQPDSVQVLIQKNTFRQPDGRAQPSEQLETEWEDTVQREKGDNENAIGKGGDFYSNMTLSERSRFQQAQVDKFCNKYGLHDTQLSLPRSHSRDQQVLYRHLLLNDKAKTIFCFAPKVGCTNLKLLFFVTQGMIPKDELDKSRDSVNQHRLEDAMRKQSLNRRSKKTSLLILQRYFKFVMLRNPLERLVSGYRSKVQRFPLIGLRENSPHYNWLRRRIYSLTHPEEYKTWLKQNGTQGVNISFVDFVKFWLSLSDKDNTDEHFQPIFKLCQPCRVRYDYYGDFKSFDNDARVLVKAIGGSVDSLRNGYYEKSDTDTVPTKDLLSQLYGSLSLSQREGVVRKLSSELDFYYHVFPAERDIHKRILNVSIDLR